jgi:hypothetical protein
VAWPCSTCRRRFDVEAFGGRRGRVDRVSGNIVEGASNGAGLIRTAGGTHTSARVVAGAACVLVSLAALRMRPGAAPPG